MTTETTDTTAEDTRLALLAEIERCREDIREALRIGDEAALSGDREAMFSAIEASSRAYVAFKAAEDAYWATIREQYAAMGVSRKDRRKLGYRSRVTPR